MRKNREIKAASTLEHLFLKEIKQSDCSSNVQVSLENSEKKLHSILHSLIDNQYYCVLKSLMVKRGIEVSKYVSTLCLQLLNPFHPLCELAKQNLTEFDKGTGIEHLLTIQVLKAFQYRKEKAKTLLQYAHFQSPEMQLTHLN